MQPFTSFHTGLSSLFFTVVFFTIPEQINKLIIVYVLRYLVSPRVNSASLGISQTSNRLPSNGDAGAFVYHYQFFNEANHIELNMRYTFDRSILSILHCYWSGSGPANFSGSLPLLLRAHVQQPLRWNIAWPLDHWNDVRNRFLLIWVFRFPSKSLMYTIANRLSY